MKGERVMSELETNNFVTITTFREDGEEPQFYAEPTMTDLAAFMRDVGWKGGQAEYVFEFEAPRPYEFAPLFLGTCWKLNGVKHKPVGINIVVGAVDDPYSTGDVEVPYVASAGDKFKVTISPDEVDVTDPTRWAPYMYDAVAGGVLYKGIPSRTVFVSDESELDRFTDARPGCIAIQYGFGQMWQMDGSGEWTVIGAEEDES